MISMPVLVAQYDQRKVNELLANPGIIRNRLKITAAIENARRFLAIQEEFGSFDKYVWRFVNHRPIRNQWKTAEAPKHTMRIRCNEQGPEGARIQVCRNDHLLCIYAGRRDGQ